MLPAILAVALLLLLPGGLMLLAPWRVRPFLSAAFWIASWWWLPRLGPGRTAFLEGALVAFGLLGLTRFLKPIGFRRPSLAAGLVCGAMALVVLAPFSSRWPLAPDAAFDALTARLLVDRDGVPATYEPLLPIPVFGLRPPGLSGLAADAGLLAVAGLPEALLAAAGVAQALLLLAAFNVLRRRVADRPAALGACGLALLAAALGGLSSGTLLGLALALAAAPHVVSPDKAPTTAAGVLLGASVLCGGLAAPLLVLGACLVRPRGSRSPIALAAGVAALVVAPSLLRVSPATFLAPPAWSRVLSVERLPNADERAAMAWLEGNTGPLAVACAEDAPAAAWIPAVAGRALVHAGRAGPLPSGIQGPPPPRPCSLFYGSPPPRASGPALFRSGAVTIVEVSKSLR